MTTDDARLIQRILADRDEGAFHALVVRHAPAGLRLAHSVTRDAGLAEDALQEAFVTVSRRLRRFDRARPFRAWFSGIVYRCALKAASRHARQRRREHQEVVPMSPRVPGQPHDAAARAETRRAVAEELATLAPDQRAALQLRYGESLTYGELAEALAIRPGTAKSRVSRALDALRGRLERRGVALGAGLPALLADLPAPAPTAALIDACVGHGMAALAAKTGAAGLWAAAAAVALTVTGVAVSLGEPDAPPERARAAHVAAGDPPRARDRETGPDTPAGRADGTGGAEAGADTELRAAGPDGERPGAGTAAPATKPAPAPQGGSDPAAGPLRVGPGGTLERGALAGAQVRTGDGAAGAALPGGPRRGGQPLRPGARGGPRAPGGTPPRYPEPPRTHGDATVAGQVVDDTGAPLAGAEIWRILEDAPFDADDPVMSAEFMNRVGVSDDEGHFTLERQKAGRVILLANHGGALNVPMRGLDTTHRREFVVQAGQRLDGAVLPVPVTLSDAATLAGIVVDAAGDPVAGAQVWIDTRVRVLTDGDGAFDFASVPPGEVTVTAQCVGYEDAARAVTLEPHAREELTLAMELLHAGDRRIAGQVLDSRGEAVPDAQLYLNGGNGTLRKLRTDEAGRFAFERLPAELEELTLSINVWPPDRWYPIRLEPVPFPTDALDLRVDVAVPLRFAVVSAADGAPVQRLRYRILMPKIVDGEETWSARVTGGRFVEDGVVDDHHVPLGGRVRLQVEAPGHEPWEADLDTNPAGERVEVTVTLQPVPVPE